MPPATGELGFYRALIALETDATRYYGADATRPAILGVNDAEQLLSHLAADLSTLLPDISGCSLIAAGALFDQVQILRPGYPVYAALEATARGQEKRFRPRLVSIGARGGRLPVADLQPLEDIPLGLLQLLPFVVHGPAAAVAELGQAMEYRFMEEGQLSAHSAAWLQAAFGVSINHARLMTLTDLNAMLRLQLEHFGFLPLWELIDAALSGRTEPLSVRADSGREYHWREGAVFADFETFDHWAQRGAGAELAAERGLLAGGYGSWTREHRQYLTTLRAHGITMQQQLPGAGQALDGSYLVERSETAAQDGDAAVTEHSFNDLGTVAVTVVSDGRVANYYPLSARGLNDIHAAIGSRGGTIAFPGTILYDAKKRCLQPDSWPGQFADGT
jgi:hypothetical protein